MSAAISKSGTEHVDFELGSSHFGINHVALSRPFQWLRKGISDFAHHPLLSLLYGVIVVGGCYAVLVLARETPAIMFGFITGLMLIGPFLAIGLYEAARQRAAGERVSIRGTLSAVRARMLPIALIAVALGFIMIAWLRVSTIIFALKFGLLAGTSTAYASGLFQPEYLPALLFYLGIGFLFAFFVFATNALSLPIVLDRNADALTAMVTSFKAVSLNKGAMLVWGLILTALAIIGVATAFFGFAVIFPVLGYATWHSYRDVIDDE